MPPDNPDHIPALDGLRGIAILMVILWHYVAFTQPFFPGWAGVDLFFVLSGYLITWKLMAAKGQPHYFSRFYRNRALRILPLYYILVLGFFLAVSLFVKEKSLPTLDIYIHHWKSFLIFTQNWTFIFFGRPRDPSLTPLWSLAVEEQFYLVWPLIILLTPDSTFRLKVFPFLLLLVLLVRTACYLSAPPSGESAYYNTFFRMDGFLTGSLLFQLHNARIKIAGYWIKWSICILFAISVLCCLLIKNVIPYNPFFATAGYTVLALLFACLLHLAVQPGYHAFAVFLTGKFLRFCGRISYCLYLVHVPILQIIQPRLSILGIKWWPDHALFFHWTGIILSLAVSFLICIASGRYFESWFLQLKAGPAVPPLKTENR
jgi:peptidoglycan/LPS O-acetylase OafA/YrhL